MTPRTPVVYLVALCALAVVGIIVLAALGQAVPDVLSGIALGALTASAGVAQPAHAHATAAPVPAAPAAG